MSEPRNLKTSGPWCWQDKAARRRIRDAFDATGNVASALSVYDALTEIASNEQAETFRAAHAFVAGLAGVSAPTVKRVFPVLREIGLIHVETPALRAPSVVTLLAQGEPTLGNGDLTLAHGDPALAHGRKRGERSTSEESDEESSEETPEGAVLADHAFVDWFLELLKTTNAPRPRLTPKLRAPSRFTLLSVRQSLPNDAQPMPSVRQRSFSAPLPTSEELRQNPEEPLPGFAGAGETPRKQRKPDPLFDAIAEAFGYFGAGRRRLYGWRLQSTSSTNRNRRERNTRCSLRNYSHRRSWLRRSTRDTVSWCRPDSSAR